MYGGDDDFTYTPAKPQQPVDDGFTYTPATRSQPKTDWVDGYSKDQIRAVLAAQVQKEGKDYDHALS